MIKNDIELITICNIFYIILGYSIVVLKVTSVIIKTYIKLRVRVFSSNSNQRLIQLLKINKRNWINTD